MNITYYMYQERLNLELKMIFGDDYPNYNFINSDHAKIMLMYGKSGLSYENTVRATTKHNDVMISLAKCGLYPNDEVIFDLINKFA